LAKDFLKNYLKELNNTYQRGDAREESYYQHLNILIKELAETLQFKNIDVTTLPKKPKPAIRIFASGMAKTILPVILKLKILPIPIWILLKPLSS